MTLQDYLTPGYQTPPAILTPSVDDQARRLECCGVGADAHQGCWAAGLLGTNCFAHLVEDAGQDIRGSVHVDMRLIQEAPIPCDNQLTVQGITETAEPAAKGTMVRMAFQFTPSGGTAPVRCDIGVLVPDPDRMGGPRKSGPPPADPRDGFELTASRQLNPADVTGYGGAGNPIHDDPEFARSLGFRAPIAHGVMTAVWLLGALDDPAAPARLDASFVFKRPVFWDDAMELWRESTAAGGLGRYRALNGDAKVTAEMTVADVGYL